MKMFPIQWIYWWFVLCQLGEKNIVGKCCWMLNYWLFSRSEEKTEGKLLSREIFLNRDVPSKEEANNHNLKLRPYLNLTLGRPEANAFKPKIKNSFYRFTRISFKKVDIFWTPEFNRWWYRATTCVTTKQTKDIPWATNTRIFLLSLK